MKRALIVLLIAMAPLGACVPVPVRVPVPAYGYAVPAPPPPRVEIRGMAPANSFWVNGHWFWAGGRYAWRPGFWEVRRPGRTWVPGYWQSRPGFGFYWTDGRWR
jgi:hypothetical protein